MDRVCKRQSNRGTEGGEQRGGGVMISNWTIYFYI